MKYSEESWIPNSKEVGEWGDLHFGGWIDGWCGEDLRKLEIQRWWMVARDRQAWKKVLQKAEAYYGL
jgi:hypothetical protein